MSVINSGVVSGGVFVLDIDAFRNAFELYPLHLSVGCERAIVIPSDRRHIRLFSVDAPVKSHVVRCEIVVCIRIYKRCSRGIVARVFAFVFAVFNFDAFRNSVERNAVHISVICEAVILAPGYAAHVVRSLGDLPLVLCRARQSVVAVKRQSGEILAGRNFFSAFVLILCIFRQVRHIDALWAAIINVFFVSRPLKLRWIEHDALYLPLARSDLTRLLVIRLIEDELRCRGVLTCRATGVVLVSGSHALRKSCKADSVIEAVVFKRAVIVPVHL